MKKVTVLLAATAMLFGACCTKQETAPADPAVKRTEDRLNAVLATVNGEPISLGDVLQLTEAKEFQAASAFTGETLAKAVTGLFNPATEIKVIGIRHGEKMYETLLTKEEAAKAIDMGNFYAVPADNRDLNYDKYFKEGDVKRATIEEFNSNNTKRLNLEETKEKIASLTYIQNELNGIPNLV